MKNVLARKHGTLSTSNGSNTSFRDLKVVFDDSLRRLRELYSAKLKIFITGKILSEKLGKLSDNILQFTDKFAKWSYAMFPPLGSPDSLFTATRLTIHIKLIEYKKWLSRFIDVFS